MSVKQILFNTEMVRAILDGRKSCTRRIVKHDVKAILNSPYHKEHPEVEDKQIISKLCMPPHQIGDILYVRETWYKGLERYMYRADYSDTEKFYRDGKEIEMKWHPSLHMPKDAARIFLRVTNVRVERLQEITEDEAVKEGVYQSNCKECNAPFGCDACPDEGYNEIDGFADLWNSTIKKSDLDRYGWDANPWVWVIEFERCDKPESEE